MPQERSIWERLCRPILKRGGSEERTPLAVLSLLNKISIIHVKTNCLIELQRGKSSTPILRPPAVIPNWTARTTDFLDKIEKCDRFLSELMSKERVSATSVRNHVPCLCWRLEISANFFVGVATFTRRWKQSVSDNHFRLVSPLPVAGRSIPSHPPHSRYFVK